MLKEKGYQFDIAYTSLLKRAIKTLYMVQEELDLHWIPVVRHWRLNERHYGALQGLNKSETAAKYGEAQVKVWLFWLHSHFWETLFMIMHISRNSGIIWTSENYLDLVQILQTSQIMSNCSQNYFSAFFYFVSLYCRSGVDPMTRPHQLWSPQIQDGQQVTDVTV